MPIQRGFSCNAAKPTISIKNPYLNALRLAKYEREKIRRDRREVLTVLVPTLISYCDFRRKALHLFEVTC